MNRREFIKVALASCILAGGAGSYPFLIEPNIVFKTELNVKARNIKSEFTIAHITDLHIKSYGFREIQAVNIAKNVEPDITVITGDFIEGRNGLNPLENFLSELIDDTPIYAVLGNWDYWSGCIHKLIDLLESYKVKILSNENVKTTIGSSELYIAGVDDPYTGHDDLPKALRDVKDGKLTILLAHSPQVVYNAASRGVNLILVGHTHGGQVVIPFIGPPFIPLDEPYRRFTSGIYNVDDTVMYVNRGVGTSIVNVRLLCPPEVAIIRIVSGNS